MGRNNFSPLTKLQLAAAAGYHCVRPGCNQRTHLYNQAEGKMVHIGVAAHDAPASNFGLRADNDLSPEQISAYNNGAWLCRSCATLVDIVQSNYPVGTLPEWQLQASQALAVQVMSPVPPQHINYTDALQRAKNFLKDVGKIKYEGGRGSLFVPMLTKSEIERLLSVCNYLLPLNPLSTLYTHTVNIQKRMLDDLRSVRSEITNGQTWYCVNNYPGGYQLVDKVFQPEHIRSVIDDSYLKVKSWFDDFYSAYYYLQDFSNGRTDPTVLYLW